MKKKIQLFHETYTKKYSIWLGMKTRVGCLNRMNIYLFLCIIFTLCACSSGQIMTDNANLTISTLPKKPIRVLVISENKTVLYLAAKEGFAAVFNLVESSPYDMKVVTSVVDYDLKTLSERCRGSRSNHECKGKYRLFVTSKIDIFDAQDVLQYTREENQETLLETYESALNRETARKRTRGAACGKGNKLLFSQFVEKVLCEISNSPQLAEIERSAEEARRMAEKNKINPMEKLPVECIVQFPPNLASVKAIGYFERGFVVNKERQCSTMEVSIGEIFSKELLSGLDSRFASVKNMTAVQSGKNITHNPHALAFILEVELGNPVVEGSNNKVMIPAKVNIKAPTGGIFKTEDITSQGTICISSEGGQFLSNVLMGVSILRVFSEGTIAEAALRNGTEDAIKRAVQKTMALFQPSFAKSFAEFSSYDTALKTRSPTEMKSFIQLYPDSFRRYEIEVLLEYVSFQNAQASGSVELYMDYLRSCPGGKNESEALKIALSKIRAQIDQGNLSICEIYCELARRGINDELLQQKCICP